MTSIYVVSPGHRIQIKTEISDQQTSKVTPTRPLRPLNDQRTIIDHRSPIEQQSGKVRRTLAMNNNKGNPVINNRRNARERNRVKQVNHGFAQLRQHIPAGQKNKKISKVETLRGAIDYIRSLTEVLDCHSEDHSCENVLVQEKNEITYQPFSASSFNPSPLYTTSSRDICSPVGSTDSLPPLGEPPSYVESLKELQYRRQRVEELPGREPDDFQLNDSEYDYHDVMPTRDMMQQRPRSNQNEIELISALRWWHQSNPSGGTVNSPEQQL